MGDNISAAGVTSPGPTIARRSWRQRHQSLPAARHLGCHGSRNACYNGVVYDTFVRYQGSRWNRVNGIALTTGQDHHQSTARIAPAIPPCLAGSSTFPDLWAIQNKRAKVVLNKLNQVAPAR